MLGMMTTIYTCKLNLLERNLCLILYCEMVVRTTRVAVETDNISSLRGGGHGLKQRRLCFGVSLQFILGLR
jgi:hypothetical protein